MVRAVLLLLVFIPKYSFAVVCWAANGDRFYATPESVAKFTRLITTCEPSRFDSALNSGTGRMESRQLALYDLQDKPVPRARNCKSSRPLSDASSCASGRKAKTGIQNNIYSADIERISVKFNIDPLLLHAIAHVESGYNPRAVSPAGAKGMMQVMPSTARRFGFTGSESELFDPVVNLNVSSTYLRALYNLFGNDIPLILAAYNAGEQAVMKYGGKIPPYRETRAYVKKVMTRYSELRN